MGWEDELHQTISKSAEQTRKTRKITSSQTTAHIFRSFPGTEWHEPFDIPTGISRNFQVNGKYPWTLLCRSIMAKWYKHITEVWFQALPFFCSL